MSANPKFDEIVKIAMDARLASLAHSKNAGFVVAKGASGHFHQNGIPSLLGRVGFSESGAGSKSAGVWQLCSGKTLVSPTWAICHAVLVTRIGSAVPRVWKMVRPSTLIANSSAKLSGVGSTFLRHPLTWHS